MVDGIIIALIIGLSIIMSYIIKEDIDHKRNNGNY